MKLILKIILFLWATIALGGWTPDIWPASNTSPRKVVADGKFAKDCWQVDCYSAIVERASAVGVGIKPMKLYRYERINLILAKQWIKSSCKLFVDASQSVSGSFEPYFEANPTTNRFPTLTTDRIIAMANLPSDFFELSFYRCIHSGYSTAGYGWDGVYRAITNLMLIGGAPNGTGRGAPNLFHCGGWDWAGYITNSEDRAKQGAIDNAELRIAEGWHMPYPQAGSMWAQGSSPWSHLYSATFISSFSYYQLPRPHSTNTTKTVDYYMRVTGPGWSAWCSKSNLYAITESVDGSADDTNCWSKQYGQITRMAWPSKSGSWNDNYYIFNGALYLVKYDFEYK